MSFAGLSQDSEFEFAEKFAAAMPLQRVLLAPAQPVEVAFSQEKILVDIDPASIPQQLQNLSRAKRCASPGFFRHRPLRLRPSRRSAEVATKRGNLCKRGCVEGSRVVGSTGGLAFVCTPCFTSCMHWKVYSALHPTSPPFHGHGLEGQRDVFRSCAMLEPQPQC